MTSCDVGQIVQRRCDPAHRLHEDLERGERHGRGKRVAPQGAAGGLA
ncbi:MAG: hypothetical protein ABIO63_13490 [Casimicrobiaceae bacterium]